jgi:hypothetical protein
MGKIAHCLTVVVRQRLPGSTAATPELLSQVQVAVNNVARSVVGCRREDHITILDLLEAAKYLSLNQQAVKATAMSAWTAYHSCNGTSGTRNPVGDAMFSGAEVCHGRQGPGQDERVGHPRDKRPGGVERLQGAAGLEDKG